MIRSMTGYGRAVMSAADSLQVAVEASSVNRKNLDVAISIPRDWQRLETAVAEVIRKKVGRGRINISIAVETQIDGETSAFNIDEVEKTIRELEALSGKLGVPFAPDANLLWEIAASNRGRMTLPESEAIEAELLRAVEEAIAGMIGMREKEGEALHRDLAARNEELRAQVSAIREASAGTVPDYRETLLKRLRQSGLEFALDDERVLKEIAIFADRCDISEELTRLESHLNQFDELLGSDGPIGRKLEFLLQEIGRECNTIGSKANQSQISRLVIECKNELERVREQVQNVE